MSRGSLVWLALVALLAGCGGVSPGTAPEAAPAPSSEPGMVRPGAPGEASRTAPAGASPRTAHTPADVAFMQGMTVHHAQAVEMTSLVDGRAGSDVIRTLARRIEASQEDEMQLMRRWLESRGEAVPGPHAHHQHDVHMPGMVTPEQMERLAAARGAEFDRLFLEYMIHHHEGAVVMVAQLFAADGAGQEGDIFQFASHVDSDQRMEIERMRRLRAAID